MDFDRGAGFPRHLAQKDAFALVTLDQMHAKTGSILQYNGDHQPRKAAAAAQIDPIPGIVRRQGRQLGGIEHMPAPELGKRGRRDQIDGFLPFPEQGLVEDQPGHCFT